MCAKAQHFFNNPAANAHTLALAVVPFGEVSATLHAPF